MDTTILRINARYILKQARFNLLRVDYFISSIPQDVGLALGSRRFFQALWSRRFFQALYGEFKVTWMLASMDAEVVVFPERNAAILNPPQSIEPNGWCESDKPPA